MGQFEILTASSLVDGVSRCDTVRHGRSLGSLVKTRLI
jgi:hypothetical protein